MALAPGARLATYEILAPLGSGGMGEVYRARDSRLGREVAIKVLPADVSSNPERLARFEREAKTVAALNHPNIVVIHSIEEAGGVRFLTMELVEGQSLDRVVTPGGLPLARVLDLAIPLADALVAAHERGVVHRDLKPANVMLSRDGRIKVLDFGLAKSGAEDMSLAETMAATVAAPISATGQIVGTVPYMAPEQIRGEGADPRSDLFSFGILVYELATGRRPFAGTTHADVSSSILRDVPLPVRVHRADLSRDLERIVGRCLEKDRDRRFQTAKDVRNELEIVRREMEPAPAASSTSQVGLPTPAAASSASVAVLPFANRSNNPDDEYFSDGLADELLSVLVKVRGLRVAARTSSAMFKGRNVTIAEVGRALNVATVLEGSVRKSGNRVRISVQLVKVEDGYPLWSETYDRTLDDIFAVQDDIAQSVVKELRTALLGETPDSATSGEAKAEVAAAALGRGTNPEAHRLYLQGRHFLDRMSEADMKTSMRYLSEALALDPAHALAWATLARAHVLAGGYGWEPILAAVGNARAAIERAIAVAPDLAEAYVTRSEMCRLFEWDWEAAEAASRRALELAPESAAALAEAGTLAHDLRHFEEGERLLIRAIEQDPLSSRLVSSLGQLYRHTDRFADAERCVRKALELAPNRISANLLLAITLSEQGRHDEALVAAQSEPANWARLTALCYVHWMARRRQESDAALAELIASHVVDSSYQISAMHAVRGELDQAFAALQRAIDEHDAGCAQVYAERVFRPLHGDPRWAEKMRQLRFPAEARA